MSKKDLNMAAEQAAEQEQASAAEAQAQNQEQPAEQEAQEQEEQPAEQEAQAQNQEQPAKREAPKYDIVVCAYPGTEEKMAALWKKALGDKEFLVILAGPAVSGETPVETVAEEITSLAEALIADNRVADDFVLVAPNTFPTHKLTPADIATPVVYVDNKGERKFAHRLPQIYSKDILTELLAEKEFWNPEEFAKRAVLASGLFPIEVGMSFGNYVTNVFRSAPCEHKVIEAFITKKFISCNPDGWNGITGIVDKFLSE